MGVAVAQVGKAVHGAGGIFVRCGGDGQRDEHFVGVQAGTFRAFSSAAEEAPSSEEVLPVTIVPSFSWMASAGSPVRSATSSAAGTEARLDTSMESVRISSLSLLISDSLPMP